MPAVPKLDVILALMLLVFAPLAVVAGRRGETRFLWRASSAGWVYATYKWNPDQTVAALADSAGDVVEVGAGQRPHAIPSTADCRACHESRRTEVLGFTALQLSTDRDPNAVHGEPLQPVSHQLGIPRDIDPAIGVVRVAVRDAGEFVTDHLECLALVICKRGPLRCAHVGFDEFL